MTTRTENIECIYNSSAILIAIIKRDETTGHKLVYVVTEAAIDDIVDLIKPEEKPL